MENAMFRLCFRHKFPAARMRPLVWPRSRVWLSLGLFLATLCGNGLKRTFCQESANSDTTHRQLDLAALLDDCQQNLDRLRQLSIASEDQLVRSKATIELELWQQLEIVLVQRASTLEEYALFAGAKSGEKIESTSTLVSPRSYLEVDELRDRRWATQRELETLRNELQTEKVITVEVKERHRSREQLRRSLEQEANNAGAVQPPDSADKIRLMRLECRVLSNELDLHREQAELLNARIISCEQEIARLEQMLTETTDRFVLSQEELEQRLSMIDGFESQIRDQLAEADNRLRAIMAQRNQQPEARRSNSFESVREESKLLQQLLAEVTGVKECWRHRFELSNKTARPADVSQWLEEAGRSKLRLAQVLEQLRLRASLRQQALASLKRAESNTLPTALENVGNLKAGELEHLLGVYNNILVLAASGERLFERFIEDLQVVERQFSLAEWWDLAAASALAVWNYEVTSIDDQSITVQKIVCVITLLLVGYFLSRALAAFVATRVLPKIGVSPAGAAVLKTVLYYSLLTGLTLISLDIVNVPLTVFAFLGGAVAIGVGFGSQNLINNFISGLILLVERPIRIGDLVNVDGIDANVEHVGARSTRVRTGSNLEILIPNSKFLENNVTNWTLSSTQIRTFVSVGVAYGSPLRDVAATLERVAKQHPQVLRTPEPIILFQEFGDNALTFEVHFWIHQRRMMEGAKVRSEVRLAIDDAFNEAGIVIAFPQRDVHLDMQSPLEIRLANPEKLQPLAQQYRHAS